MLTINLQGIGSHKAKQAQDIKIGDKLLWNYGYISTVKAITETKSGKSINILESYEDGKTYKRRLSKITLVGIAI